MNLKTNTQLNHNDSRKHGRAGLFRRLFAIFYDCFLLTALLFITTAVFNGVNRGKAIESSDSLYYPLVITLLIITFFFFTWFWTHGGQTLGLKTWKLQVRTLDGKNITWKQASIRFVTALFSAAAFGLGFIWSLFHDERKTWHDILSQTQLIDLRHTSVETPEE